MWQAAAEQRYTCWAEGKAEPAAAGGKGAAGAGHQAQLLDYLASPSNNFDNVDTEDMALGDGGGQIADQQRAAKKRGAVAGAVVGVVVGGALLAALGYFVVYRRLLQPAKATAFRKFEDDAAAGAGAAGAGAGGVIDMQSLPGAAAAGGPAVSAAEAAARPM
jgi:putative intracellular protease/amidase